MARVAKKPQYEAFNHRNNCYGRFQSHNLSLNDWRQTARPLMLEVGAGSAAVSVQFSLDNPNWQVLAVDRKSDRLNKVADRAASNLAFLQTDFKHLPDYLDLRHQVGLLWLAFPDPYPGKRQAKHRLTHPSNQDFYKNLLAPSGRIRFKTDDQDFFAYTYSVFSKSPDFTILSLEKDLSEAGYDSQPPDVQTITRYEAGFLSLKRPIGYLEIGVVDLF